MSVLLAAVWFLTGAIAGWGVRALRAAATMSSAREQMRREIRCWQAETERFKATADRLAQEKPTGWPRRRSPGRRASGRAGTM